MPAECDVSIRPGWFYHAAEDSKVKTAEQLFAIYLKSVGRGANLLLNVPPDRRGLIHEKDSAALIGFKNLREKSFKTNLARDARPEVHYKGGIYNQDKFLDGKEETSESLPEYDKGSFWIKFNPVKEINCIVIKEAMTTGQNIKSLELSLIKAADMTREIQLTTIGNKRIITFPKETISAIRIVIKDAKATPFIKEVEAYLIDEKLVTE